MSIVEDLPLQYASRFTGLQEYRNRVWKILLRDFFSAFIPADATVLDLGCGWGEFINNVQARQKIGMDLNPDCAARLAPDVRFIQQDCAVYWDLADNSLDLVFTSNFFEHLTSKALLNSTLAQCFRCLKPGGRIICMGPNAKYLPGQYWDFYDHYIPLTERSLCEGLELRGFRIERSIGRFLPYTMAHGRQAPLLLLEAYLRMPFAWRFFGKQFLVIGSKA